MIKNNFKILQEERDHILSLVRLPNYREPKSLFEQAGKWPASHYDFDRSQQEIDAENKLKSGDNLKSIANSMYLVRNLDLTKEDVIDSIGQQIIDRINDGYRSIIFKQYLRLLNLYGVGDAETFKSDFNTAVDDAKRTWNTNLGISTHDPLKNPTYIDEKYYVQKSLNDNYFPGMFMASGWAPKDVDVMSDDESLPCSACTLVTEKYFKRITQDPNGSKSDTTEILKFKEELVNCWDKFEIEDKKTIFGVRKLNKQCKQDKKVERYYRDYIVPLMKTDQNKNQPVNIAGKTINAAYRLDITPR